MSIDREQYQNVISEAMFLLATKKAEKKSEKEVSEIMSEFENVRNEVISVLSRQPTDLEAKDAWNLLSVQMLCSYCAEGGLEKCGEIRCQKMVRVLHKLFNIEERK